MQTKLLFIASAITLSVSVPAAAAESIIVSDNPEPQATVTVADLNLDSPDGVARLEQRIEGAASDLCLTHDVEPVGTRLARAKCYHAAVTSGRRQIDLGLADILARVRQSELHRGPRRSKAEPKSERHLKAGGKPRKSRPGKKERAARREWSRWWR